MKAPTTEYREVTRESLEAYIKNVEATRDSTILNHFSYEAVILPSLEAGDQKEYQNYLQRAHTQMPDCELLTIRINLLKKLLEAAPGHDNKDLIKIPIKPLPALVRVDA